MASPRVDVAAALERFADAAELLPYETHDGACAAHRVLLGGFYFAHTDAVAGQVVPPRARTWLAFAAFDHLTASPPDARNPQTADVLARRMQFLELLVRVSMTRACDWQTSLAGVPSREPPGRPPFRWTKVLQTLMEDEWAMPLTQPSLAALRWTHPRILIEWHHDPLPDDFPLLLELLLAGVAEDNAAKWWDMMEDDDAADAHRELNAVMRHRVVELGLVLHHGRVTTSLLFSIIEVLEKFGETQQKRREAAMARGAGVSVEFRIVSLRFDDMCSVADSAMDHLGDLVRNATFLHLDEIKLAWNGELEDRCLQRCLADLTTSAAATDQPDKSRSPPGSLTRISLKNDSKSFSVVGSAMRYACSIREVDAGYIAPDLDAFAKWLAFGLFHCDSDSGVTSVCLRMPGSHAFDEVRSPFAILSAEWIATFSRVLRSVVASDDLAPIHAKTSRGGKRKRSEPDASPLDDEPLPADQRVFVELKTDTKVRAQPQARSPIIAVVAPEEDEDEKPHLTRFQVLRKLRGWIAIAVPGAGAGWIQPTAVSSESTEKSSLSDELRGQQKPPIHSRVKSFSFMGGSPPTDEELRQQHADALMDLLEIIGEPLEELQLPSLFLRNAHVARIMTHCPNLKTLNLCDNDLLDIEPLVRAYQDGSCQITTLNVSQQGETHHQVVMQTAKILELGSDASAKCAQLERLAVRVTPFDFDRIEFYLSDVIPAIQRAVFQAPKLEYARIQCDGADHEHLTTEIAALQMRAASEQLQTQARDEWEASDQRARPMEVRNKLAFLSVVRHDSVQASALSELDRGVLALVFELARTIQPRVVHISGDAF